VVGGWLGRETGDSLSASAKQQPRAWNRLGGWRCAPGDRRDAGAAVVGYARYALKRTWGTATCSSLGLSAGRGRRLAISVGAWQRRNRAALDLIGDAGPAIAVYEPVICSRSPQLPIRKGARLKTSGIGTAGPGPSPDSLVCLATGLAATCTGVTAPDAASGIRARASGHSLVVGALAFANRGGDLATAATIRRTRAANDQERSAHDEHDDPEHVLPCT